MLYSMSFGYPVPVSRRGLASFAGEFVYTGISAVVGSVMPPERLSSLAQVSPYGEYCPSLVNR